jgi:hypothetical protein
MKIFRITNRQPYNEKDTFKKYSPPYSPNKFYFDQE